MSKSAKEDSGLQMGTLQYLETPGRGPYFVGVQRCFRVVSPCISTFGCQISRLFTHLHLKSTSLVLFVLRGLII
jgi:hypothetical protein